MQTRRILITGATGFIGGYLVKEAKALGWEVWIALRPGSNKARAEALGSRIVELDLSSERRMLATMQDLQRQSEGQGEPLWHYVVHNGGLTKALTQEEFNEANAENTHRLLTALGSLEHKPLHFVLMSSLSVYASPQGEGGIIRTSDPKTPSTAYGRSKALAERYTQESGIPYSILQPTGVYGPGDRDYLLALQSIQKGVNAMSGMRPQWLTFVYGEDVARAALFLLGREDALGRSFIISDGDAITDEGFGRLAQSTLGVRRCLHLRIPLFVLRIACNLGSLWAKLTGKLTPLNRDKYHILAQRSWLCDDSDLRALGFSPLVKLEEGLRRTIEAGISSGDLRKK